MVDTFYLQRTFNRVAIAPPGVDGAVVFAGSVSRPYASIDIWKRQSSMSNQAAPYLETQYRLQSKLTDLQVLPRLKDAAQPLNSHHDVILGTDNSGSLIMLSLDASSDETELRHLSTLHLHTGPATAFSTHRSHKGEIVTVGEDGAAVLVEMDTMKIKRRIEHASNACINAVKHSSPHSFITASSSNQIQVWDTRSSDTLLIPATFRETSNSLDTDRRVWSLDVHPDRPWIVCAGTSGSRNERPALLIHDIRGTTPYPLIHNLSMHSGSILKTRFHPEAPDVVISSSQDGTLVMWDINPPNTTSGMPNNETVHIMRLRGGDAPILDFDVDLPTNTIISCDDLETVSYTTNVIQHTGSR